MREMEAERAVAQRDLALERAKVLLRIAACPQLVYSGGPGLALVGASPFSWSGPILQLL